MSRSSVESVSPDAGRARDFLVQARRFLADADRTDSHLESAVVLYWSACISAMDAVLAAAGLRVGSGTHSHAVRIQAVAGALGDAYDDAFERLDEWRRERNDVSYAAMTPSAAETAALQGDTRDLVAAAEVFVASQQGR